MTELPGLVFCYQAIDVISNTLFGSLSLSLWFFPLVRSTLLGRGLLESVELGTASCGNAATLRSLITFPNFAPVFLKRGVKNVVVAVSEINSSSSLRGLWASQLKCFLYQLTKLWRRQ